MLETAQVTDEEHSFHLAQHNPWTCTSKTYVWQSLQISKASCEKVRNISTYALPVIASSDILTNKWDEET